MVVGIAGRYCAGKGTAAEFLLKQGFLHVDVDLVGHRMLRECKDRIVAAFGADMLTPNGEDIDRRALGEVVFSDKKKLETLESITHPAIREEVRTFLAEHAKDDVVIDAAVLFPLHLDRYCHLVIWVEALALIRAHRAKKRDGKSLVQIHAIMESQHSLSAQPSSINADTYIVNNSLGRKSLERQIEVAMSRYKKQHE